MGTTHTGRRQCIERGYELPNIYPCTFTAITGRQENHSDSNCFHTTSRLLLRYGTTEMSWHVHVTIVVLCLLTLFFHRRSRPRQQGEQERGSISICFSDSTDGDTRKDRVHFSEATMFKHCSQTASIIQSRCLSDSFSHSTAKRLQKM